MNDKTRMYSAKDFMRICVDAEKIQENYEMSLKERLKEGLKNNKFAIVCLGLLFVIILASVFASLAPYDPDEMSVMDKLQEPSIAHLFGTDQYGRDYFTRALYGGRISLAVGIGAAVCSVTIGLLLGTWSGYVGGKTDAVIMRFTDCFLSLPSTLIMIVINSLFTPGIVTLIIVISIFSWPTMARIARAETMSIKERDYVTAAKNLGASNVRIIFEHVIPNMVGSIVVTTSLMIASAILTESSLSYLGLGVQLPMASWGSMLQDAQTTFLVRPALSVYPGLLILLTVLSFNTVGNVLCDALEPKTMK